MSRMPNMRVNLICPACGQQAGRVDVVAKLFAPEGQQLELDQDAVRDWEREHPKVCRAPEQLKAILDQLDDAVRKRGGG